MHGRQTFSKRERLQRGYEFRSIYQRGRRLEGALVVLYVLDAADQSRGVGVVAARRIGNAVQRNRARRLLREVYRLNKHKLKPNLQIVMVARAAINGKSYADVEACVVELLRAAGALVES